MFRFISRTRCNYCEKYQTTSRLCRTVRYYSKKENDLCPPTQSKKGGGRGLLYTIGAFTLVGGATVAYAKYDPNFRNWLATNVPYSDKALTFILQEEKTYWENIVSALEELKYSIMGLFQDEKRRKKGTIEQIEEVPKDYKPPPKVLTTLEKEKKPDDVYTEIRMEKKEAGKDDVVVEIGGDVKPKDSDLPDTSIKNLADIEMKIGESASTAVQAYNSALYALKNYNLDVQRVIEDSVVDLDPKIWDSLKSKRETKDIAIKEAETRAAEAVQYINKLKILLNKKDFEASNTTKEQVKHNIQKVQEDITKAKKEFEQERKISDITDKYWSRVQQARKFFAEELETLFPTIKIEEKKLHVDASDFDLFVLHAFSNVLFYQKELAKLETISDAKLQQAIDGARRGGNTELLTKAQIQQQLEKEKRCIEDCYEKRCLALRCEAEKELRRQLKMQSQTFADHLGDAIKVREMEIERELTRKLDEQLEAERCKFKMQLAAIMGRLRGLEQAFKARAEADQAARQAQVLWSACQALFRSVKAGCPGVPWQKQLRPLTAEITAVKKAAAAGDELVKAVLDGIPKEAKERGVFPEDALRERFLKVERLAQSLALVPEGGGSLPIHILSYIQSLLLIKAASPIPQAELNDQEVDFSKLSTNEILQRARYWLDRGNFAQTLRYMNLLKGAPRSIAREWMYETRVLLETQQAAETLMAHAAASGLSYL